MCIRNGLGIAKSRISGNENASFDTWWYGIVPALAYAGLGVSAFMDFERSPWAPSAIAAALMTLLLVSIHAEWDLVTFLAPDAPNTASEKEE